MLSKISPAEPQKATSSLCFSHLFFSFLCFSQNSLLSSLLLQNVPLSSRKKLPFNQLPLPKNISNGLLKAKPLPHSSASLHYSLLRRHPLPAAGNLSKSTSSLAASICSSNGQYIPMYASPPDWLPKPLLWFPHGFSGVDTWLTKALPRGKIELQGRNDLKGGLHI